MNAPLRFKDSSGRTLVRYSPSTGRPGCSVIPADTEVTVYHPDQPATGWSL